MPRFASEEQVMAELERLHDLSLESVGDYEHAARRAAEAEATHKVLRAKRILLAKGNGVKSIAEAEYTAEADLDVAGALMERLTSEAQADAIRERLRSIRTNQEALRTMAASRRPANLGGP